MADQLIGRTLLNRYQIKRFIGRGGMADVYEVWDQERLASLAMKVLHQDLAEDVVFLRRFQREAQTLEQLKHPNIVRTYGLERDGLLAFILMDYVEGTTLRSLITRYVGRGMDGARLLHYLRPICAALHYAHRQSLVHCDVKPANVMIHKNGTVLVTDFGIARMTDSGTSTMQGIGTPAYMAPEQIRGEDSTPATDIYALGIMLFEMLTGGERPFSGERAQTTGSITDKVRWEHLNLPPLPLGSFRPELPPSVETVILKCLEKNPGNRYRSIPDLLSAMEEAFESAADQADEASSLSQASTVVEMPAAGLISHSPHAAEATRREPYLPIAPSTAQPAERTAPPAARKRGLSWWVLAGGALLLVALITCALVVVFGGNLARMLGGGAADIPTAADDQASMTPTQEGVSLVLPGGSTPTSEPTGETSAETLESTEEPTPTSPPEVIYLGGGGGQIAFMSYRTGTEDIFLINDDGSGEAALTSNQGRNFAPNFSPDGTKMVFYSTMDGNAEIYIIDLSTREITRLTNNEAHDSDPDWSPDGQQIAFMSNRSGNDDIYVMDADGSNVTRLTTDPAKDQWPDWSPDGSQIAFSSQRGGSAWTIYVMDADGGNQQAIFASNANNTGPIWSPDGTQIAFTSNQNTTNDVYLVHSDGASPVRLTNNGANNDSPAWSPDGMYIVFSSDKAGNYDIYIMEASGRNIVQLTDHPSHDMLPDWQP